MQPVCYSFDYSPQLELQLVVLDRKTGKLQIAPLQIPPFRSCGSYHLDRLYLKSCAKVKIGRLKSGYIAILQTARIVSHEEHLCFLADPDISIDALPIVLKNGRLLKLTHPSSWLCDNLTSASYFQSQVIYSDQIFLDIKNRRISTNSTSWLPEDVSICEIYCKLQISHCSPVGLTHSPNRHNRLYGFTDRISDLIDLCNNYTDKELVELHGIIQYCNSSMTKPNLIILSPFVREKFPFWNELVFMFSTGLHCGVVLREFLRRIKLRRSSFNC